jgi:hypothetical protein
LKRGDAFIDDKYSVPYFQEHFSIIEKCNMDQFSISTTINKEGKSGFGGVKKHEIFNF